MVRSAQESLVRLVNKPYALDIMVVGLAWATQIIIWLNMAQTLPLSSLQMLWQSAHQPQTVFQWLIHPVAHSDMLAVIVMGLLSSLSLWLFCRIARLIGLSNIVTFALFLLINFNPEYNDVRLTVEPFQLVMVLWLLSVGLFILWYQQHLYRAFIAWAVMLWLAALFDSYAIVWALGFPLCFMFWPSGRYFWWQRVLERGKFMLVYYAVIALVVLLIPSLRESVWQSYVRIIEQFHLVSGEISLFLSDDSSFNLSGLDGFLITMVLVAINALRIAGLLILIFVWIAVWRFRQSVLAGRVQLFFIFCLAFSWVYAALSLLYFGYLQSDLIYIPIIMIILWLSASGVFYVVDRWRYGHIRPERQLIIAWLFVAYALASVISFGPSADYKRAAGLWARTQAYGKLYSNDLQPLYYAGYSPLSSNQSHNFSIEYQRPGAVGIKAQDIILHTQSRHRQLPPTFERYEVIKVFANSRGDRIFALRIKPAVDNE